MASEREEIRGTDDIFDTTRDYYKRRKLSAPVKPSEKVVHSIESSKYIDYGPDRFNHDNVYPGMFKKGYNPSAAQLNENKLKILAAKDFDEILRPSK